MFVIGNWIKRHHADRFVQPTVWHLVESVIDGDAITRCGKRMAPRTRAKVDNGLLVATTKSRISDRGWICIPCNWA